MALIDLLGPYVRDAVTKTAGKPDRRGWVRCTIPIESSDDGLRELLRLRDDVEVLAPAALRAAMAAALRSTLRRYTSPAAPASVTRRRESA